MTKPTVLVIAPTPYFSDRGCHIRIYEELKLINQLGYQAKLVTYGLGRNVGDADIYRTNSLPWYHKTSAGPALSKLLLDLLMIPLAYRLTKQLKPNIIHAHLTESILVAYWLKLKWRIPIVLDLQSVMDIELRSYGGIWKLWAPFARLYEHWAIAQADQILVSNRNGATILQKRYPNKSIVLLADGIGQIHNEITKKTYDIVYSGGLGTQKGTPELINILRTVSQKKILIIAPDPKNIWRKIIPHTTWFDHVPYEELLRTLAQAKIGLEPKPIESTEGSAKELNYMAAGVVPARTTTEVNQLLTDQVWYQEKVVDLSHQVQQHLWSNQLPLLKKVYESCTT